jgi:hypothetical protein
MNVKFNVVPITGRGRGCIAITDIEPGEILLQESPTVVVQTPLNCLSNWCCTTCLVPLGSLRGQLERLGCVGVDPPMLEEQEADAPLHENGNGDSFVRCPTCIDDGDEPSGESQGLPSSSASSNQTKEDSHIAWYCSEPCRATDWRLRHRAFCSSSVEHRRAARKFRAFADKK